MDDPSEGSELYPERQAFRFSDEQNSFRLGRGRFLGRHDTDTSRRVAVPSRPISWCHNGVTRDIRSLLEAGFAMMIRGSKIKFKNSNFARRGYFGVFGFRKKGIPDLAGSPQFRDDTWQRYPLTTRVCYSGITNYGHIYTNTVHSTS